MFKKHRPSLLILGASGGVARAVLILLNQYRFLFNKLILLDKIDTIIKDEYLNHKKLNYEFIKYDLNNGIDEMFLQIKQKHGVSIILDLTDCETLPLLKAADKLSMNYLNCSVNSDSSSMIDFVENMKEYISKYSNAVHVLALGMNPGIINHLIVRGVLEHGMPLEYIEIEFDSGCSTKKKISKPFITWSKTQFLNEAVRDPAGYCGEGGNYVELETPAVENLCDTSELIGPIKKMKKYPQGMIVPHDEIITMSRALEIPGKFIYAIHPESLNKLIKLRKEKKDIFEKDLEYLDNVSTPLSGSDCIGVWLLYKNKKVCYFIDLEHSAVVGTNATLFLVALGVIAGLVDFVNNPLLEKGVLTPIDLDNKVFLDVISNHVSFREVII